MAFNTRVNFDPVRELAFGGISGTYAAVGTPLTNPSRMVAFNNATDVMVYISFDGVNNHLKLASNSFKLFDFATNRIQEDGFFVSIGTQFYVKQVSGAASTNGVWIEVCYGASTD